MNKWVKAQEWENGGIIYEMKYIPLSQGKRAIVSDEDYEYLNQFKWYCNHDYAIRHPKMVNGIREGKIAMHRIVNKTPDGLHTDHINGNTLDNRRENLRTVTSQQNSMNSKRPENNSSGHKGVTWHSRDKVWTARIMYKGKRYNLGNFDNINSAVKAYETKKRELFGEYRREK